MPDLPAALPTGDQDAPPKHILFNDLRTGTSFVIEIPPTSPWHALLPAHQETEIHPLLPGQAALP